MKRIIKTLVLVITANIVFFGGLNYYFFHSMASLPKGEYICESVSPQGTYTVKLYYTNPALSSGGTRGELTINKSRLSRNIYWEDNGYLYVSKRFLGFDITGTDIMWEDDDSVVINGIKLELPGDIYDFRRDRMAFLPLGEFISESTSPRGRYSIKLFSTNPATTNAGTRGELTIIRNGKKHNIYWEHNEEIMEGGLVTSDIVWESEAIVVINGKRLKLPNEKYDWSRDRQQQSSSSRVPVEAANAKRKCGRLRR